jgi:hypothetical protein
MPRPFSLQLEFISMADPKDTAAATAAAEDEKAKKAKAEKTSTETPAPVPSQAEADAMKEGKPAITPQARDVKAQPTTANYKTR